MNVIEFQKYAKRTCPDLGSSELNASHMALGLYTELGELYTALHHMHKAIDEVNVREELGDFMWYIANMANQVDYPLMEVTAGTHTFGFNELFKQSTVLADVIKKHMAYGRELDLQKVTDELFLLNIMCHNFYDMGIKVDLELAMEKVIAKLRIRYPEKFTADAALNRNLDAERTAQE